METKHDDKSSQEYGPFVSLLVHPEKRAMQLTKEPPNEYLTASPLL